LLITLWVTRIEIDESIQLSGAVCSEKKGVTTSQRFVHGVRRGQFEGERGGCAQLKKWGGGGRTKEEGGNENCRALYSSWEKTKCGRDKVGRGQNSHIPPSPKELASRSFPV